MYKEIKARKAKYGFNFGPITLSKVVKIGKFVEALQYAHQEDTYIAEEVGYHSSDLKIYTDDNSVADWIRGYNFN